MPDQDTQINGHEPSTSAVKTEVQAARAPEGSLSPSYPPPLVFSINLFALCIAVFCVALDNTVLATATPKITDQFHSLQDVGWYGSAYFLTTCAFQLPFGKIYRLFNPKWVFLASLAIFEVGSLVCAVAPSSVALIVGRAIAGAGAAGVFSGALIIIGHTSPMHKRPVWQSVLSGMFGIASSIGPLIGGAFTDHVTWRWCFYINLPLGFVTASIIVFFLRLAQTTNSLKDMTLFEIFWNLDPLGFVLFLPSMICLFLALQWGGTTYAWDNGRIIALFVVFGITLIAFVGVQVWLGEGATIPPRIATQRTMWSASWVSFCISGGYFLFIYFVPIYFQAVKGTTALQSGIDNIPRLLANVLTIMVSGFGVSRFGYYNPFVYASVILSSVGAGMLTTLTPDASAAEWIGYQILYGIGSGMGFQQPPNAAQAVLPIKDMPTGIAVTMFFRHFGAALFVITGNNVLNTKLFQYLSASSTPGVSAEAVVAAGATSFRNVVPSQSLDAVIGMYNHAVQKTFELGTIISSLAVIGAVFMEWKSMKPKKSPLKLVENGAAEKPEN
ncbi:MFS general substrate transporter [Lojkania enalia]|uniref:MFS general substrate transporter n=1 Tax=Lojkania enalia TaxID=147567 RepID=A0A9P4KC79_9PLEO|nr:MFS general substrate transporter [Didymosphaeria enalia]